MSMNIIPQNAPLYVANFCLADPVVGLVTGWVESSARDTLDPVVAYFEADAEWDGGRAYVQMPNLAQLRLFPTYEAAAAAVSAVREERIARLDEEQRQVEKAMGEYPCPRCNELLVPYRPNPIRPVDGWHCAKCGVYPARKS